MKFELLRTIEILSATPSAVSALLAGLSDEWTSGGTADEWQAYDIVGHLIHCEVADWMPRARMIIEHGEGSTFEPLDRLAQFENKEGESMTALLARFAYLRGENLELLLSWQITDEQLALTGRHPELGTVTLAQLLATWAVHDLNHIRQISTVMANRYNKAVGPWREYLSILK